MVVSTSPAFPLGQDAAEEIPPDRVRVEPATEGVHVLGAPPVGDPAEVVIPWHQAVEVSRRILQLARNRGDVS